MANVIGTIGNDDLFGTLSADIIRSFSGDDTITSGAGDDTIRSASGDDTINSGDDNDEVFGGSGNDTIDGGSGNDTLHGDEDNDVISGGSGNDSIFGGSGNDNINGNENNDVIVGGSGNDTIDGGSGNDNIHGDEGDDGIVGGNGNDTIVGGSGSDILSGGIGNDLLVAPVGTTANARIGDTDVLTGGSGSDRFVLVTNTETSSGSLGDWAIITDLDVANDQIIVSQAISNYSVQQSGNDTNIIFTNPNRTSDEKVVAQVRDVNANDVEDVLVDVLGATPPSSNVSVDLGVAGVSTGASAAETFVVGFDSTAPFNGATIIDFEDGVDKIDVSQLGIRNFSEFSTGRFSSGGVDFGNGHTTVQGQTGNYADTFSATLTVYGANLSGGSQQFLDASDFIFA